MTKLIQKFWLITFICRLVHHISYYNLSTDLQAGETVAVYADLEGQCRKGLKEEYRERKLYVGCGEMQLSRDQIFCSAQVKLRLVICL